MVVANKADGGACKGWHLFCNVKYTHFMKKFLTYMAVVSKHWPHDQKTLHGVVQINYKKLRFQMVTSKSVFMDTDMEILCYN